MKLRWRFSHKIVAGFALIVALTVVSSIVSVRALTAVVAAKDRVVTYHAQSLTDAAKLQADVGWKAASVNAFLLTGNEVHETLADERAGAARQIIQKLRAAGGDSERNELLARIEAADAEYDRLHQAVVVLKKSGRPSEEISRAYEETILPTRVRRERAIDDFVAHEARLLQEAIDASTRRALSAQRTVFGVVAVSVMAALLLAFLLSRRLSTDIGSAVHHVRTSSAELQSAANQQVTSAREQATSMSEISTTVSELLATSRQIAESARSVTRIADETSASAHQSEKIGRATQDSIYTIKRQMDAVVSHMLELGRKSQQIGTVVDIIDEFAEQTNILAINASIEAAGAGENGRRFAVVADEIRKLAERTGGSTREITTLVEEIRAAVNATVMATEGSAKAVDAGARQFNEAAAALAQIVKMVGTSTDAAREIELSTKQQATAVEQVNVAIVSAAQATRESETSSSQTLQTAAQLTNLSGELARIV